MAAFRPAMLMRPSSLVARAFRPAMLPTTRLVSTTAPLRTDPTLFPVRAFRRAPLFCPAVLPWLAPTACPSAAPPCLP
jgi:hypothetical protein